MCQIIKIQNVLPSEPQNFENVSSACFYVTFRGTGLSFQAIRCTDYGLLENRSASRDCFERQHFSDFQAKGRFDTRFQFLYYLRKLKYVNVSSYFNFFNFIPTM